MFKILPVVLSVALMGAGGLAASHAGLMQSSVSSSPQVAQSVMQPPSDISPGDSSDLFLNADISNGFDGQAAEQGAMHANLNRVNTLNIQSSDFLQASI